MSMGLSSKALNQKRIDSRISPSTANLHGLMRVGGATFGGSGEEVEREYFWVLNARGAAEDLGRWVPSLCFTGP
jgi:hypothetical protein